MAKKTTKKSTKRTKQKLICSNCDKEFEGDEIRRELYDSPFDKSPKNCVFCSEECEEDYVYGGDFCYELCEDCNRMVIIRCPSNGWMGYFRNYNGGEMCLQCFFDDISKNGISKESLQSGKLNGMFVNDGDLEPLGWKQYKDAFVQGSSHAEDLCLEMLSLMDKDNKIFFIEFTSMAIGGLEGHIRIWEKDNPIKKKEEEKKEVKEYSRKVEIELFDSESDGVFILQPDYPDDEYPWKCSLGIKNGNDLPLVLAIEFVDLRENGLEVFNAEGEAVDEDDPCFEPYDEECDDEDEKDKDTTMYTTLLTGSIMVRKDKINKEIIQKCADSCGIPSDEIDVVNYEDLMRDCGLGCNVSLTSVKFGGFNDTMKGKYITTEDGNYVLSDDVDIEDFIKEYIVPQTTAIFGLIGFYLDKYTRRIGSTGWDELKYFINLKYPADAAMERWKKEKESKKVGDDDE